MWKQTLTGVPVLSSRYPLASTGNIAYAATLKELTWRTRNASALKEKRDRKDFEKKNS